MSPPLVFRRILRFSVESPGFPPVNGNERERTGTNGNEPCNQPALGASLAKVTICSTSPYKQLIINVVCVCVLLSLSRLGISGIYFLPNFLSWFLSGFVLVSLGAYQGTNKFVFLGFECFAKP